MSGKHPDESIDFLVFSAHKMYAPYGIGVIVGLSNDLNTLPFLKGGGAVKTAVSYTHLIEENIIMHNPDIVISVGQAGGRAGITPERIAINIDDARIPDNETKQPIDIPIFEDGENA